MAATWGDLPVDLKHIVFAALSLLDLGRAAPTCREFRAAYESRLAAAHPLAIQAAVSLYGEPFLKAQSTLISKLSSGVPLFGGSGPSLSAEAHILGDGTLHPGLGLGHDIKPASCVIYHPGTSDSPIDALWFMVESKPRFWLLCQRDGKYLCFNLNCDAADCGEVAWAFAAICEYLAQADSLGTSPPGQRRPRRLSARFI